MKNNRHTCFWSILLVSILINCVACENQQTPEDANTKQPGNAKPDDSVDAIRDQEAVAAPDFTGDWPMFRGDPMSQGVAKSALPEKLSVIWKHEIKNGAFEGTPIIVGQRQKRVYIGDADGKLFAFDLDTGNIEWEFESEIGYVTAPAFRDGKIFIGDLDGKFYCIDESGELVWEFQAADSIYSSANFHNGKVFFGTVGAQLFALNAETGKKVWRLETDDQIQCSITVADGHAFVAGCDGAVHIIDLDRGKEIDNVSIESPTLVTPAAAGESVFVGTEQSGFHAIDWKKAELKWSFNDPAGAISTRSSPSVYAQHVVFGARNRRVYSINSVTGKKNWSTLLKANIDSSPVIVRDRVFVGTTDGRLNELDLKTGKIVWQKQFIGGFIGSPAVGFGRLVIATDEGVVYCLGSR